MNPVKPHHQIDYVELASKDLAATKEFYGSVFGWKFEDYGAESTSFYDGRLAGGFYAGDVPAVGNVLLVLYSEQLEATEAKIRAAGGAIVKETFSFPGGRRFHFTDPNGHELAVWSE